MVDARLIKKIYKVDVSKISEKEKETQQYKPQRPPYTRPVEKKPVPRKTVPVGTEVGLSIVKSDISDQQSQQTQNVKKLKSTYESIHPSSKYVYTIEGKEYTGHQARQLIQEQIRQGERNIPKIESTKRSLENIPSDTRFIKTNSGYTVKETDRLSWAKSKFKKRDTIGGPVGVIYEMGLSGFSHIASMAMSSMKHPQTLIIPTGPASKQIKGSTKAIEKKGLEIERTVHFPTVYDPVFEPIGLAPKGSGKLVTSRPVFLATGVAIEAASAYGIGKLTKPVTGRLGSKLKNVIRKPKTVDPDMLTGRMVKPAYQTAKTTKGAISLRTFRFKQRIGLGRTIEQTDDILYKTTRTGIPMRTESGKLVFRSQKMFTTAKMPKYGESSIYGAISYEPKSKQMLLNITRVSSTKPSGIFRTSVKFKVERGSILYKNISLGSDALKTKPSMVFKTGKPIPTTSWMRGENIGGSVRNVTKLQPKYAGKSVYTTTLKGVSSGGVINVPVSDIGSRVFTRVSSVSSSVFKPVFNVRPRFNQNFEPVFSIKSSDIAGSIIYPKIDVRVGSRVGFKDVVSPVQSFDVLSSQKIKSGQMQGVSPVYGFKSVNVLKPKISNIVNPLSERGIPNVFPDAGLFGRGSRSYSLGGIGFTHKFREFKIKPLLKGWKF